MDLHQRGRSKREAVEVRLLSWPVAAVLAGAIAGMGIATGAAQGKIKLYCGIAVVLLSVLSAFIAWLRGSKTGGYKRAAARYAELVAGAGQPVVTALGELCSAPPNGGADDARLVALRRCVIDTVRLQCGTTGAESTRAVIYEFRGSRDLRRADYSGRRSLPREVFEESDVQMGGREVVQFAASVDGRVDRVQDVHGTPGPRGGVRRHSDYRSYMSTAISVAGKSWGLLAVDSPDAGAFRETDEGTIALLAGSLAAGLAHAGVSPHAPSTATVAE